jgi:hypothetical protein
VTFAQWLKRVDKELGLTSTEFRNARNWYREMRRLIKKEYPELAEKDVGILAFAATQKAASPTQGILNLNRMLDALAGAKGRGKPGVSRKSLSEILGEEETVSGFAEKLSDFADALFGRKYRSWTGRGGKFQPGPIDRHAYVDAGYITEALASYLRKQGIKVPKDIPRSVGTEGQYVNALRFYNELAAWLNKKGVDGGGWTASEAQAVGWTAVRKGMGLIPEDAATSVSRHFRTVAADITSFSPRSDLGRAVRDRGGLTLQESVQITERLAPEVSKRAAKATGVKVKTMVVDRGASATGGTATTYIKVMGSPETAAEFGAVIRKATRKKSVPVFRRAPGGKTPAVVFELKRKLSGDQVLAAWNRAMEAELQGNLGMSWLKDLNFSRDGSTLIVYKPKGLTAAQWKNAQVSLSRFFGKLVKTEMKTAKLEAQPAANLKKARPGAEKATKELADWFKAEFLKALDELRGTSAS